MRLLGVVLAMILLMQSAFAAWTVRYVDAAAAGGGDGTTTATSGANGAWTLAEAATASNTSAGMQVNIKAGNYTPGAIAFSDDGSAGSPIWFRGYNTTPGDCDELDTALTLPAINMETNQLSCTGAYNWFTGLNITGATTTSNGVFYVNDVDHLLWNCRVEATAANSSSRALSIGSSGGGTQLVGCYFKSTTTASSIINLGAASPIVLGCVLDGGAVGVNNGGAVGTVMYCIFDDQSSHACTMTAVDGHFINNTVYSAGGDGVRYTAAANGGVVANNIFDSCTGNAINSSAATGASILIVNNSYYNNGAELAGIIESQQIGGNSEADSPLVNPGSNDFSVESDSLSKAGAYPGLFENLSLTGYLDAGAVQRQEAGGGTNATINLNGNLQ